MTFCLFFTTSAPGVTIKSVRKCCKNTYLTAKFFGHVIRFVASRLTSSLTSTYGLLQLCNIFSLHLQTLFNFIQGFLLYINTRHHYHEKSRKIVQQYFGFLTKKILVRCAFLLIYPEIHLLLQIQVQVNSLLKMDLGWTLTEQFNILQCFDSFFSFKS